MSAGKITILNLFSILTRNGTFDKFIPNYDNITMTHGKNTVHFTDGKVSADVSIPEANFNKKEQRKCLHDTFEYIIGWIQTRINDQIIFGPSGEHGIFFYRILHYSTLSSTLVLILDLAYWYVIRNELVTYYLEYARYSYGHGDIEDNPSDGIYNHIIISLSEHNKCKNAVYKCIVSMPEYFICNNPGKSFYGKLKSEIGHYFYRDCFDYCRHENISEYDLYNFNNTQKRNTKFGYIQNNNTDLNQYLDNRSDTNNNSNTNNNSDIDNDSDLDNGSDYDVGSNYNNDPYSDDDSSELEITVNHGRNSDAEVDYSYHNRNKAYKQWALETISSFDLYKIMKL